MSKTKLLDVIEAGMANGGDLVELLQPHPDLGPATIAEAKAICDALKRLPLPDDKVSVSSRLHPLTGLFQQVASQAAYDMLKAEGVPLLCEIVKSNLDSEEYSVISDLMFVLKVLAMYPTPDGIGLIVDMARRGYNPTGFLWSVILGLFDHEHPYTAVILTELSSPELGSSSLPAEFIGVSLMDCANAALIGGLQVPHPFDTKAGKDQVRAWLQNSNEAEFSYAHSATASLPFLSEPERGELLELAMNHADGNVQMEAAWASAKLGNDGGVQMLTRFALDPNYSKMAKQYLNELGHSDAIPDEADEPHFAAMAEMSQWLAHPQEFGRAPDRIELYDSQFMYWPPTHDERTLWLFKYQYEAHGDNIKDVGIGMVGSLTFALFGESTADKSPLDIYGLHCCWELEMNGDDRAPAKRSAEAGRSILAHYNQDLGF